MRNISLLLGFLILLCITFSCMFTVQETDNAILIRLGVLLLNSDDSVKVLKPGLHFKIPIVEEARSFDRRLHMLDIQSSRIFTIEKKYVLVDFYVQWRIDNLGLFYTRTDGRKHKAEALLEQKVVSGLRAEFGRRTINEVVSGERIELMERLKKTTDENVGNLGLTVVDVRIKRIDLPDEVSGSVYDRMRSERERVASEIRAEGRAEAIKKRAEADKIKRVLLSEANRKSREIQGEGEAAAVKIYAEAYSEDPNFFEFYRSLEAYRNSFSKKGDVLVLKPDSEFFKFFKGIDNK